MPFNTQITVTAEKTQAAAQRLVQGEGYSDLVLLNFASARHPGGGFITGARAQEEDLCRCSGLYPCLVKQTDYYDYNRNQESLLYSDHLIYSPQVPWFRQDNRDLLEQVYLASVITAPAPNAGETLKRNPQAGPLIEATLRQRAGLVLTIAKAQGQHNLLLGAWGCGVFRNQAAMVADAFATWLAAPEFKGCFQHVCFAVYDTTKQQINLRAFQERFA